MKTLRGVIKERGTRALLHFRPLPPPQAPEEKKP